MLVRIATLVIVGVLAASPVRAESDSSSDDVVASGAGMSAVAALCSLIYAPVKVAYAAGGSIVAGLGYALSGGDEAVARPILNAALRGDYFVTPEQLRGEKPIEFIGRSPENEALRASTEATPAVGSAPEPPGAHESAAKEAPGGGWN